MDTIQRSVGWVFGGLSRWLRSLNSAFVVARNQACAVWIFTLKNAHACGHHNTMVISQNRPAAELAGGKHPVPPIAISIIYTLGLDSTIRTKTAGRMGL